MNDKDTTLIPDKDAPPLAERLQRIADHEHGRRPTVPRVIRSMWRTRDYAAFYRRYGPKADPWLYHKTQGRAALRLGLPVLLLTTTGARSGLPRVMPLIYVRDGDGFVVIGTNFGSGTTPAGRRT